MAYGRVLVTAYTNDQEKATLVVDLDTGASEVLVPYFGGICVVDDCLIIARQEYDKTRLEAHDREGLRWMRRIRDCIDTHSLCPTQDGLAICSTGTNEIIQLDRNGVETGRWSPCADAEGDSWHVNSLVARGNRLFTTCFGKFDRFRGWAGRIKGSGLLMEVGSGRVELNGLSAPHDPRPIDGGWILNDAANSATLLYTGSGPHRVLFETPGFARGLEVFDDVLVVGSSSHRLNRQATSGSFLFVVGRETGRLRNVVALPYQEVGHIIAAPGEEILEAIRRDARLGALGLSPQSGPIAERDRAGSIEVVGPCHPFEGKPNAVAIPVRITNQGTRVWSSHDDPPLHLASRIFDRDSEGFRGGLRTFLPIPIQPGRALTFDASIEFPELGRDLGDAEIEITLIQEHVAWWSATDLWRPAVIGPAARRLVPA